MRLTKVERNVVYNAIKESVLDLSECRINVVGTRTVSVIHSSGSEFTINNYADHYTAYARVTDDREEFSLENYPDAQEVSQYTNSILTWAEKVKEFIEAHDLWAEMANNREFVIETQGTDTSNTPFTKDEQSKIEAQLREITKQLKEQFELTKEQGERIGEWRDEAIEASTRMGRKDWRLLVYGSIINLVLNDVVTPGVARQIFTMVIRGLIHLFGGGPPQILS